MFQTLDDDILKDSIFGNQFRKTEDALRVIIGLCVCGGYIECTGIETVVDARVMIAGGCGWT